MKNMNIRLLSLFVILTTTLVYVYTIASIKYNAFVDTWPLNDIILETIVFLVTISLLSSRMFYTIKSSTLFVYTITVAMVVYLPLLKYPNDLWLYGIWDSSAHYSFTSWIVEKGHAPANNELYYSDQYGHHPGNGLLPAILNIISGVNPLPVPMSMILLASYTTYALLLLALAILPSVQNMAKYLLTLSSLTLSTLYLPYYGGVELAYAYVALIAYYIVNISSSKNRITTSYILVLAITYLGLLVSHLSTAVITLFFTILAFLGTSILERLQVLHKGSKKLISTILVLGISFLVYEIYVDIYLMGLTLRQGIQRLIELYIRELMLAKRYIEYNPYISIMDLITYLISQYTKNFIILAGIGLYVLYHIFKSGVCLKKNHRINSIMSEESILFTLLIPSLPTWLIGWFGVGSFMGGGRALPLIQFFFGISVLRRLSKNKLLNVQNPSKQLVIGSSFIALFILGFVSNYSIHIGPYLKSLEGDSYTYPVWTQGTISPFVLNSVKFLNNFLAKDGAYRFLCVQPYIGFGLCDLLWNKPKTPMHGSVGPELTTPKAMIELLERYVNAVIPMPTSDRVVPGPLGYSNFYHKPFYYAVINGRGVMYSNLYYLLVIK